MHGRVAHNETEPYEYTPESNMFQGDKKVSSARASNKKKSVAFHMSESQVEEIGKELTPAAAAEAAARKQAAKQRRSMLVPTTSLEAVVPSSSKPKAAASTASGGPRLRKGLTTKGADLSVAAPRAAGRPSRGPEAIPLHYNRGITMRRQVTAVTNFKKKHISEERRQRKIEFNNRQKQYHRIFNQWRDFDFISTTLAMIGLTLALVNYEIDIANDQIPLDPSKYGDNAMLEPRNQKPTTNMFRLIVMITSLLSAGCLIMKHYYKVLWLNEHFHQETDTHIYVQYQEVLMDTQMHNLKKKEKFFNSWIVIEVLVLLVCPIPYYD